MFERNARTLGYGRNSKRSSSLTPAKRNQPHNTAGTILKDGHLAANLVLDLLAANQRTVEKRSGGEDDPFRTVLTHGRRSHETSRANRWSQVSLLITQGSIKDQWC